MVLQAPPSERIDFFVDLLNRLLAHVADLRRRRVLRVAIGYLVAGWVVVEVTATTFPLLGLPVWAATFVLVLVLCGLPVALALAWAYDLTPEGVKRAEPGRARSLVATLALVTLVASGGAWLALRRPAAADVPVGAGAAVAVLPFGTGGATPELGYLEEGVMDLLAALLEERGGVSAVPARLVLAEMETGGAPRAPARAAEVARRLGSAAIVTGEVVGSRERLTVTAALVDASSARAMARASVSGPEQALEELVERIAAQLLVRPAVPAASRSAELESSPLPALRDYLEGLALKRRGRFEDALDRFRAALSMDSTFAQAAVQLLSAAGWAAISAEEQERVQNLAWAARDRLSAGDRVLLEARLGPRFPLPSTAAERMAAAERAVEMAPRTGDAWYLLGDALVHDGAMLGVRDWRRQAVRALVRARQLDPGGGEAEFHLLQFAPVVGDTTLFDAVVDSILARDTRGSLAANASFAAAVVRGDPALVARYRAARDSMTPLELSELPQTAYHLRAGAAEAYEAARLARDRAATPLERAWGSYTRNQMLLNMGRPAELLDMAERDGANAPVASRTETHQVAVWAMLDGDLEEERGRASLAVLRALLDAERAAGRSVRAYPVCTLAFADALQGRGATARRWLPVVGEQAAAQEEPTLAGANRICGEVLAALVAWTDRRPELADVVAELERHVRTGPVSEPRMIQLANWALARIHEDLGDLPAALAALERTECWDSPVRITPALRERARLLEKLGRVEDATRLYLDYLALRPAPEPPGAMMDAAIREHLARLPSRGG